MKAMILAAGLGTRLKPLTDSVPKALIEIHKKLLLQYAIEKVKSAGCYEIIINVHHHADQVIEFVKNYNDPEITLSISDESDMLLDTGGAIKNATWFLNTGESFLVYNADILSKFDLNHFINSHKQNEAIATLAVSDRESSRYLLFDENKNLAAWKNEKTGEKKIARSGKNFKKYAFSGIYILDRDIFNFMPDVRKFSIIDVLLSAAKEKDLKAYFHRSEEILDVGKPDSLTIAEKFLKQGE